MAVAFHPKEEPEGSTWKGRKSKKMSNMKHKQMLLKNINTTKKKGLFNTITISIPGTRNKKKKENEENNSSPEKAVVHRHHNPQLNTTHRMDARHPIVCILASTRHSRGLFETQVEPHDM
jgi:hypothetical protein